MKAVTGQKKCVRCRHCRTHKADPRRMGMCQRCYRDPDVREQYQPRCRHCLVNWANRTRGLCWVCYYTPGVKDRYPPTSKFAARGLGIGCFASRPASHPCPHPIGSEGRIQTMQERATRRESLFHPGDCRAVQPREEGSEG